MKCDRLLLQSGRIRIDIKLILQVGDLLLAVMTPRPLGRSILVIQLVLLNKLIVEEELLLLIQIQIQVHVACSDCEHQLMLQTGLESQDIGVTQIPSWDIGRDGFLFGAAFIILLIL